MRGRCLPVMCCARHFRLYPDAGDASSSKGFLIAETLEMKRNAGTRAAPIRSSVGSTKETKTAGLEPVKRAKTRKPALHHVVYVVFLRNPKGDGKAGYYVGMTGLTP